MTTPKVNTIKRSGSRFYVSPTDKTLKYPGVTSVLGMLPKEFLRYWAAKMVAQEAVEDVGTLVSMVLRDPAAAQDHLKKAPDRFTRKAADTGTAAHDYFERMGRGEKLGRVHPEVEPFVRHFGEFLDVVQPELHMLEETVWSDTHQYAGSFDGFGTIDGAPLWLDWKTTRSGVHEEVGLQLAAYRFADFIIDADGSSKPMPKAEGGAVLHVRPEGWKLVPVKADEQSFELFLHLREIFRYEKEWKRDMIGTPVYSGPAENAPTGPKRRVPRAVATATAAAKAVAA